MKDTIKVESFKECLDALIEDIKNDREKLDRAYQNMEYIEKTKGYTRSIMLVEEARERWMKQIEEGVFE